MLVIDYLKLKNNLTADDKITVNQIQEKVNRASVTPDRIKGYMVPLLDLLHKGLAVDQVRFINDIFFDFYVLRTSAEPHLVRIYENLRDIGKYNPWLSFIFGEK